MIRKSPELQLWLLLLLFVSLCPAADSQTVSGWFSPGADVDWYEPANWSNGVPQAAGDQADIFALNRSVGSPFVSSPVTLGLLRFNGFATSVPSVKGTAVLTFDQPGDAPARLVVNPDLPADVAILATPFGIAEGERLEVEVPEGSGLRLEGSIVTSGGDVTKVGSGELVLSQPSTSWGGSLSIEAGNAIVEEVNALAGTQQLRIAQGATLTFVSQDDAGQRTEDYLVPQITLDGGVWQTNRSPDTSFTDVATDLVVTNDSTIKVSSDDILRIQGPVSGPGGLRFEQLLDPNADQSYDATELVIDGPTSYEGETHIGDLRVVFTHRDAMGSDSAGTFVNGGTLELADGGGGEQIRVHGGTLALRAAESAYSHHIQLANGSTIMGSTGGDFPATVTERVNYGGGVQIGLTAVSSGGVLAGGLEGTGSVFLSDDAEVGGELRARGNIFAHSLGPNVLSGKLHQAGDVYVTNDGDSVVLAGDLGAPKGHFYVLPDFFHPRMQVSHDNTLEAVTLDPRLGERVQFFERTAISAIDGATLTVTEELQFLGGVLRGRFTGQQVLTKKDATPGYLEDIAGSGFERVDVERGSLTITGDAGDAPPEVHLSGHFSAAARVFASEYAGDVYLNNSGGNARTLSNARLELVDAALTLGVRTTMRGDIYLGYRGSSIAGFSSQAAVLAPESRIHGGDLTIRGAGLHIRGGQHTYTGSTRIMSGSVVLEEEGRLNSTDAILGARTGGPRAKLVLDNSTLGSNNDRIPDATPVHVDGMRLGLIGSASESVTETLGIVRATRGLSDLEVTHPDSAPGATTLRIETLDRQPGAMVQFHRHGDGAQIEMGEQPLLDDGLLGGWARFGGDDFATYGPNGVVAYSDLHAYVTDFASATAGDNVDLVRETPRLTSDKSVNALRGRESHVILDGHTLVIESGGLLDTDHRFSTILGPGQLTAGQGSGGELFITGNHRIEADITDNGTLPVGLTYSSTLDNNTAHLVLSGVNTYSGPTTVNSDERTAIVEVTTSTALPEGGDVVLNGGNLRLNFNSETPLLLGNLVLRDSAQVSTSNALTPTVEPNNVQVESGVVGVPVVGDAPIVKIGPASASLFRSLAGHTGPIDIQQGILGIDAIGAAPLDDAHAITVHQGAQLSGVTGMVFAGRKIRLDGGSIYDLGRAVAAPIEVLPNGGTLQVGRGASEITSVITGTGLLNVEGGYGDGAYNYFNAALSAFGGDLLFTGGRIWIENDNAGYSGEVTVAAASLRTVHSHALGNGKATVPTGGMIFVADDLDATIDLAGGIIGFDGGSNAQLNGSLRISDDSRIFLPPPNHLIDPKPRLAGTLALDEGTNLSVLGDPSAAGNAASHLQSGRREQLQIDGRVIVSGTATITSFDALVELTGSIEPGTANATLLLEGNDTFDLRASLNLVESRSLSIEVDGKTAPLELAGPAGISGNGALRADVTLSDGATLAPGTSPGTLTIDGDVTMGPAAIYEWEVGSAGSDLISIDGTLSFEATPEAPWILEINELDRALPFEDAEWLIASAVEIDGFSGDAVQIVTGSINRNFQRSMADTFSLEQRGNELFLTLTVPEPTAAAIIFCLCHVALFGRFGLGRRRAQSCYKNERQEQPKLATIR